LSGCLDETTVAGLVHRRLGIGEAERALEVPAGRFNRHRGDERVPPHEVLALEVPAGRLNRHRGGRDILDVRARPPGRRLVGRYLIQSLIGRGAMGTA